MSLLAQLKKDSLLARKAADGVRATLLSTLIAEAEMVGKNAGNRESTDDEVQQTIRKFLKNNQEAVAVIKDTDRLAVLEQESAILTAYLPPMASESPSPVITKTLRSGLAVLRPVAMALARPCMPWKPYVLT